jgi:hypothetical protein
MTRSILRPKRREWFLASTAIALLSLATFAAVAWRTPWSPGRFWGLVFGTVAAAVFVLDALYPLRRRLMGWPFGTAQRWLQFHLYGGVLAALFVLIHVGFRLPAGQFGWWLFALVVWTTVTGLVGVWLQKWIPTMIASQLSVEAIYERIPNLATRLQAEADTIVRGSSDVLERFYSGEVRSSLAGVAPSWSFLADLRGGRERRLAPFRNVEPFLSDEDRGRLKDLEAVVTEKVELDAHYSAQRALRLWLPVHLFPAMALLGLLGVHVLAVSYL